MSKREYAAKRLNEFMHQSGHVGPEQMIDFIIDAVKEEIIPKDQTFQEFFGLDKEPRLIQGYTAEQWQEIIDGGYLCEFSFSPVFNDIVYGQLEKYTSQEPSGNRFKELSNVRWPCCRPAQIKGVMRPIFVEPVDFTTCLYFDKGGEYLGKGATGIDVFKDSATKYIEV